jgi:hypothetical protein
MAQRPARSPTRGSLAARFRRHSADLLLGEVLPDLGVAGMLPERAGRRRGARRPGAPGRFSPKSKTSAVVFDRRPNGLWWAGRAQWHQSAKPRAPSRSWGGEQVGAETLVSNAARKYPLAGRPVLVNQHGRDAEELAIDPERPFGDLPGVATDPFPSPSPTPSRKTRTTPRRLGCTRWTRRCPRRSTPRRRPPTTRRSRCPFRPPTRPAAERSDQYRPRVGRHACIRDRRPRPHRARRPSQSPSDRPTWTA